MLASRAPRVASRLCPAILLTTADRQLALLATVFPFFQPQLDRDARALRGWRFHDEVHAAAFLRPCRDRARLTRRRQGRRFDASAANRPLDGDAQRPAAGNDEVVAALLDRMVCVQEPLHRPAVGRLDLILDRKAVRRSEGKRAVEPRERRCRQVGRGDVGLDPRRGRAEVRGGDADRVEVGGFHRTKDIVVAFLALSHAAHRDRVVMPRLRLPGVSRVAGQIPAVGPEDEAAVAGLGGTSAAAASILFTWGTGRVVDVAGYTPVFIVAGLLGPAGLIAGAFARRSDRAAA